MSQLVTELSNLGFSPLNIALIVVVVTLWRRGTEKDAAQTRDREAWHEETRKRVDTLSAHTEQCDKDRSALKTKVEMLENTVRGFRTCPKTDCPKRLP